MKQMIAREIMNPNVITVRENMTVSELAAVLTDNEISGVPVEDDSGTLVGVVSLTDIVRSASEGGAKPLSRSERGFFEAGWDEEFEYNELEQLHLQDPGLRVADIMTRNAYTIEEKAPVPEVARSMLKGHLHRMLVTRGGKVVGIISTSDLLELLLEEE